MFDKTVPKFPAAFRRRIKGAHQTIETIKPLVYFVSTNHVMEITRALQEYEEVVRPFVDLDLLSAATNDALKANFLQAKSINSTIVAKRARIQWPHLQQKFGERLVVPPSEFSEVADSELDDLVATRQSILGALTSVTREVNERLSTSLRILNSRNDLVGLLDLEDFRRALFLSDYFNLNPHNRVSERAAKRFELDKSAFHGHAISAFIVGPAGFGKTSFCRWHTIEDDRLFSERRHGWISVYIPLHRLERTAFQVLADTIAEHARLTSEYFGRLRSRRAGYRIYLDGLDEVVDEDDRLRVLSLLRKKPRVDGLPTAYVVTSRDYLIGPDTLGIPRLSLSPLSDDKVVELSRLWLQDERLIATLKKQLVATPALFELAKIPLLGTLIILVFSRTRALPENKLRLYEAFISLLCSGWDLAKGVQRRAKHKAEFKILVLRRVAFHVHVGRKRAFKATDINAALAELDVRYDSEDISVLLDELLADGVIQRAGQDLEFRHLSFQEYLAAVDLFHDPLRENAGSCLESYLEGDNWYRDVLQFYVLLLRDPVAAVRWIDREITGRHIKRKDGCKAAIQSLKSIARQGLAGL